MSEFQHQNSTSVARVNFFKKQAVFRYHTKGGSNQVSSNLYFIHAQIPVLKWEKKEKWENIFWFTKRGNKGIKNRDRF